jgi:hypothetical protein
MKNQFEINPIKPVNVICIIVTLAWFGLIPLVQAVVPAPDGGYAGFNTAQGQNALFSLNAGTGLANTAVGAFSLWSNVEASSNTAVGTGTLLFSTAAENTAVGAAALLFNTTGEHNTATGVRALFSNTAGDENVAAGYEALANNTVGNRNTANGIFALTSNTEGSGNTAVGHYALISNTTGAGNTGAGDSALQFNSAGVNNTALGHNALQIATGNFNTALGAGAGQNQTSGSGNVYIGLMSGVSGENDHTYIRNINTTSVSGGGTDAVTIDLTTGLLGHASSSRRYKEDIQPMDDASEALFALKPVTFRYKKEINHRQSLEYGLIAEDVAQVDSNLAIRDKNGQIENVRYSAINAMLLNEFLKEHKKVEELEASLEAVNARLKEQAAQIQKVTVQVNATKALPHLVMNNP